MDSNLGSHDKLILSVILGHPNVSSSIKDRIKAKAGYSNLFRAFLLALPSIHEDLAHELLDRLMSCATVESALHLMIHRVDGTHEDHGVVSVRVVTTAGVTYLANASGHGLYDFNFQGLGTGTTAPAATDTALQTELTSASFSTSYRPAGTQSNAASGANWKYTTVATSTASAAITPTELGVFTASAAGTLFDRFTFAGVPLAIGDSLQGTISATLNSGG